MLGGRPSAADSRESAAEGLPPSILPDLGDFFDLKLLSNWYILTK